MKIVLNVLLITIFFSVVVMAQTPNNRLDECDDMPETMWSVDNPAYLLISRLSEVLAEGLGKK